MIEYDKNLFYTICLFLGFFWAFIESLIAYWLYQIYKITKNKNGK
jgi:hypothetical protein